MSERSNLAIGTGVGAAAGAGAGLAVALRNAKTYKPVYLQEFLKTGLKNLEPGTDEFIKAESELTKEFAQKFFPEIKTALKKHWIGPLAAVGAATGLATAAIVNKVKASKAEKAQ